MSERLLERITSRGYWEIQIRPATFVPQLIPYTHLEPAMLASRVQLRGWDFPHRWKDELQRGQDWIEDAGEWMYYLEQWRFHQSGLLVYYAAQHLDWLELATHLGSFIQRYGSLQPRQGVGVIETLHRFTDLYEFAARLALREELGAVERMHLSITIADLEHRTLVFEDPRWALGRPAVPVNMREYAVTYEHSRQTLIATARELALTAAREFFVRFAYEPSIQALGALADQR